MATASSCTPAKSGQGIDDLLEAILIQAEVLEPKAVVDGMASGVVIESFLDRAVARLPPCWCRKLLSASGRHRAVRSGIRPCVRAMRDELGREIRKRVRPLPVEILSLSGVPSAGDEATVVRDEKKAHEAALYRQGRFQRKSKLARQQKAKLENMFAK